MGDYSPVALMLMKMIVINALRPDRFIQSSKELFRKVINEESLMGQINLE